MYVRPRLGAAPYSAPGIDPGTPTVSMSPHGPGGPCGPAGRRSAFGFVPPHCAGQAVPRPPGALFGLPFAAAGLVFPHTTATTGAGA
ncbi:hypothetical protein GCM10010215_60210 [Streptomyces virginiae]|uniref:Uncharacterized protein n=1 Tax=Streptomyces virginiae TaxID=1961 RepID=A0ABQ3NV39_STRVG|nr:hypothetical protein ADK49_12700 [Streptomyces sp. WM6349]KOV44648.1 hypothetical protein ADK98_18210 [Streptomyces sp. H036]GGQ27946.1 hypothetical protein GCM10010215_60210 [Streptomyces virginiae]GHI16641.1 hypothetical protein Scinn_61040 [Streptomyces virginiae]GLV95519.1 hypothetical protein Slala04_69720 [Streptomyces lavendulae subsp. lavendulae]